MIIKESVLVVVLPVENIFQPCFVFWTSGNNFQRVVHKKRELWRLMIANEVSENHENRNVWNRRTGGMNIIELCPCESYTDLQCTQKYYFQYCQQILFWILSKSTNIVVQNNAFHDTKHCASVSCMMSNRDGWHQKGWDEQAAMSGWWYAALG